MCCSFKRHTSQEVIRSVRSAILKCCSVSGIKFVLLDYTHFCCLHDLFLVTHLERLVFVPHSCCYKLVVLSDQCLLWDLDCSCRRIFFFFLQCSHSIFGIRMPACIFPIVARSTFTIYIYCKSVQFENPCNYCQCLRYLAEKRYFAMLKLPTASTLGDFCALNTGEQEVF